jgi:deoxyribose-phosphate aldolase
VKASGGIRTLDEVRDMLEAGASRIGTSSSVAILESYMEQQRALQNYLAGQGAASSK